MTATPRLGITQLEEDQALPEAVVNEGVHDLEGFANSPHFKSRTTTAEPGSPSDGDMYLLPTSSTGTNWAGHDGEIAKFVNTAWKFYPSLEGFIAWVDDDDELLVCDGTDWNPVSSGGGAIEVQDEGSTETAALVSLNFTGAGVTATDDGSGNVDVDIPGATGASSLLYSSFSAGGTPASTTETDLQTYTVPANTLAANGKILRIRASGTMSATTRSRTIKLYIGSLSFSFVGPTTTNTHVIWYLDAECMRTASNGVRTWRISSVVSSATGILATNFNSEDGTPDWTSTVVVKITGTVGGSPVANDIVCNYYKVALES